MKLPKKQQSILLFAAVFAVVFLAVFSAITLTQSAYSTPPQSILYVDTMDINVGPPPNSTNIPLGTTITIDALAIADLNDLQLTPKVPISHVSSETTGPLTYKTTFYPAEPLNPATTYNVSVTISENPVSWVFTTTTTPFQPTASFYLATNNLWISLTIAGATTAIAVVAVWFRSQPRTRA